MTIDRLERKGNARRAHDPADGRRVLLRITEAGVRVREAKSVLDPVRVEQVLEELHPRDREAALKGLELLARAADEHMNSLSAGRRSSFEPRTKNDEPRTTNPEPRTTNVERRTTRRQP